jgi:sporulation protein YlmC with PRC-barrel domain
VVQLVELGELNWKKVLTSDGFVIGQLEGGKLDTNSWQLTHVNIGLNDEALREFDLKKPFLGRVLICLPVNMIKSVGDTVTLKQSLQELKESKECKEFMIR